MSLDIWFSQMDTENVKTSIRVDKQLYSVQSEYQRIDVFESQEFGKMIVLDGDVIFSEADEFIYNEMIVHVPMAVHPNVKNVLIIGGGDGVVYDRNDAGQNSGTESSNTDNGGTEND